MATAVKRECLGSYTPTSLECTSCGSRAKCIILSRPRGDSLSGTEHRILNYATFLLESFGFGNRIDKLLIAVLREVQGNKDVKGILKTRTNHRIVYAACMAVSAKTGMDFTVLLSNWKSPVILRKSVCKQCIDRDGTMINPGWTLTDDDNWDQGGYVYCKSAGQKITKPLPSCPYVIEHKMRGVNFPPELLPVRAEGGNVYESVRCVENVGIADSFSVGSVYLTPLWDDADSIPQVGIVVVVDDLGHHVECEDEMFEPAWDVFPDDINNDIFADALCLSNTGMEESFDVGATYLVPIRTDGVYQETKRDLVVIVNNSGDNVECFKDRFEIVVEE